MSLCSVLLQNVVMFGVIYFHYYYAVVVIHNVNMLNVIMLNVIMHNVMAPCFQNTQEKKFQNIFISYPFTPWAYSIDLSTLVMNFMV